MNGWWLAAGALAAFTTLVHLIAGHRAPLGVMLDAAFDEVSKRTMHVVWHLVTIDLALSAAALVAAGAWPERVSSQVPGFVAIHHGLYAVAFVVIALGSRLPRGLWKLPQWTLFVPMTALTAAGYW